MARRGVGRRATKGGPVKGTMILFSMLLTSCASSPPPAEAPEELIEIHCEPGDACCVPPPYRTYGCFSRMARRI
jgi:hypothetical protein